MKKERHLSKVISICSSTGVQGKTGYAVNLAAALAKVAEARVMLIGAKTSYANIVSLIKSPHAPDIGIDILNAERIGRQDIEQAKNMFEYVVLDLAPEIDESMYEILSYSDVVHFFSDSIRDNLENGYIFLEGLLKRGLGDVHGKLKVVVNRMNLFDKLSIEDMSWLIRRDVWAVVPEFGLLDAYIDTQGNPLVLKSPDSEYSKAILRIAKSEAGRLLGLALGSGAAFGLAHIGVLKVMEEHQIPIDVLSGSSIGAVIAGMWGLGFSIQKIESIGKRLKNIIYVVSLLDFTVPISGILAGRKIKRFLRRIFGEKTFEDLVTPVKIMVYDLANRETIAKDKGRIADAVYMSIAVPGIFKPKVQKERVFIDGGISDPVPVDALLKQGVQKIIAVNVLPGPEDIYRRNMILKKRWEKEEDLMRTAPFYIKTGLIIRRFLRRIFTPNIFDVIMSSMQSMEYMIAENSCKKADIALHPVFADATSIDFHLVKNFIKTGEEETAARIEEIKRLAFT